MIPAYGQAIVRHLNSHMLDLYHLNRGDTMSTTIIKSQTLPQSYSSSTMISLIGAMLIGALIIFGSGFSNTAAVHNAAHDMRHANVFPCH